MKYPYLEQRQGQYSVRTLCRALGVSPSGFYAWRQRQSRPVEAQEQDLLAQIKRIHASSRGTYGSPRVHIELQNDGYCVNRKRVARLMRRAGLVGRRKGRKMNPTSRCAPDTVAPNLLAREFQAEAANQKWVADITYIPTHEGWLYLAAVMDLYSRKIVGWSMQAEVTAELVQDALQMALYERQPAAGLLHHSDRGSQYTSRSLHQMLAAHKIVASMSRTGNCWDNAVMESFFSTLKNEWVSFQGYRSRAEAKLDIFAYIAGFYNRERLHSTLGYLSPEQFEDQHCQPA